MSRIHWTSLTKYWSTVCNLNHTWPVIPHVHIHKGTFTSDKSRNCCWSIGQSQRELTGTWYLDPYLLESFCMSEMGLKHSHMDSTRWVTVQLKVAHVGLGFTSPALVLVHVSRSIHCAMCVLASMRVSQRTCSPLMRYVNRPLRKGNLTVGVNRDDKRSSKAWRQN